MERGERLEGSGRQDCRAGARLCLLAEDALEPVPVDSTSTFGRRRGVAGPVRVGPEDADCLRAETIRDAMLGLLRRSR